MHNLGLKNTNSGRPVCAKMFVLFLFLFFYATLYGIANKIKTVYLLLRVPFIFHLFHFLQVETLLPWMSTSSVLIYMIIFCSSKISRYSSHVVYALILMSGYGHTLSRAMISGAVKWWLLPILMRRSGDSVLMMLMTFDLLCVILHSAVSRWLAWWPSVGGKRMAERSFEDSC